MGQAEEAPGSELCSLDLTSMSSLLTIVPALLLLLAVFLLSEFVYMFVSEEVPPRSSVPLTFRLVSALLDFAGKLYYKPDYTMNRTLYKWFDPKAKARSKPIGGISSRDIVYGEHPSQFVRIFSSSLSSSQQEDHPKLPVIVFFHGGGFVTYAADTAIYDMFCRSVAKAAHAIVVSANYRLAPEFKYPTAYDDCWGALQRIKSDCENGYLHSIADPSKVFLMGDSAGGNIAHSMMVRAAKEEISLRPLQIQGVILVCPFLGGVERTPAEICMPGPDAHFLHLKQADWFWAAFLPVGSDRDHQASNVLLGPNSEDISSLPLPPLLVIIGSMDILQDWQQRYVNKLREMGKQVQTRFFNMCHGEYVFNSKDQTINTVVEFIKSVLYN